MLSSLTLQEQQVVVVLRQHAHRRGHQALVVALLLIAPDGLKQLAGHLLSNRLLHVRHKAVARTLSVTLKRRHRICLNGKR